MHTPLHILAATTSTTTKSSQKTSGSTYTLLFIVVIFAAVYLLFIRPRQQKLRQQQTATRQLSVGDQIVTAGGIYGRVVALDADVAEVEVAPGVIMTLLRRAVSLRPDAPAALPRCLTRRSGRPTRSATATEWTSPPPTRPTSTPDHATQPDLVAGLHHQPGRHRLDPDPGFRGQAAAGPGPQGRGVGRAATAGDSRPAQLGQAVSIIERRVNGLGVANSNVARQGNDIVINLPGIKNSQGALKVLGETASPYFRPVYCQIPVYAAGRLHPAHHPARQPTTEGDHLLHPAHQRHHGQSPGPGGGGHPPRVGAGSGRGFGHDHPLDHRGPAGDHHRAEHARHHRAGRLELTPSSNDCSASNAAQLPTTTVRTTRPRPRSSCRTTTTPSATSSARRT